MSKTVKAYTQEGQKAHRPFFSKSKAIQVAQAGKSRSRHTPDDSRLCPVCGARLTINFGYVFCTQSGCSFWEEEG